MKRCSTCNKTFTDPNLIFCVDDGTPLTPINDDDNEVTQVKPTGSTAPAYQPPSYIPPGKTHEQKRRNVPWVVAVLGVVVLALAGLSIAAVIFIPRMVKRAKPVIVSQNNSNGSTSQTNSSENLNDQNNANAESTVTGPPPTDKEVVLAQLRDLENEWTAANLNADKKKLGQILADDYVGPNEQGKMQGKVEYINTVERNTSVQKWELEDLRLTLRGDRATLIGKIRYYIQDREVVFDFVDRFVWREGRWQATGSEVSQNQ